MISFPPQAEVVGGSAAAQLEWVRAELRQRDKLLRICEEATLAGAVMVLPDDGCVDRVRGVITTAHPLASVKPARHIAAGDKVAVFDVYSGAIRYEVVLVVDYAWGADLIRLIVPSRPDLAPHVSEAPDDLGMFILAFMALIVVLIGIMCLTA